MMNRAGEGKQVKPGLGTTKMSGNKGRAPNGDPNFETPADNVSEMGDGPAEKVKTGRELKAKSDMKVSGSAMRGGDQTQTRGAIMRNK